jgi:hypothetical protein
MFSMEAGGKGSLAKAANSRCIPAKENFGPLL